MEASDRTVVPPISKTSACTPVRRTAAITEKADEIAFGAALRQELRSLALAQHLRADLPPSLMPEALSRLRLARLHAIGAKEEFRAFKVGSHRDVGWGFLRDMRHLWQRAADRWLSTHLASEDARSTVDLSAFVVPEIRPGLDGG